MELVEWFFESMDVRSATFHVTCLGSELVGKLIFDMILFPQ